MDHKFEASLSYMMRPCLSKREKEGRKEGRKKKYAWENCAYARPCFGYQDVEINKTLKKPAPELDIGGSCL
jgi:hypothetical protein